MFFGAIASLAVTGSLLLGPSPSSTGGPASPEPKMTSSSVGEEDPPAADERGNTVLSREAKVPSFDVSALARFVVMLGETRDLTQPVGYGFGMVMRVHPWRVGSAHLGFAFSGGHVRSPQLLSLPPSDDPTGPESPRWQRVAMSDFAGGLSFRAPLGPVVFTSELGGGLVIGEFLRPTSSSATDDERFESVDPSVRAGLWLGAPFRNDHGVVVGVALTKVFSGLEVQSAGGNLFTPFDFMTELSIGYQGWF